LFEVSKSTLGYFSSLEKAELAMKENIEKFNNNDKDFGYWINEHVIDKTVYWRAKSRRSYLPDGSLWDETIASEISDENDGLEEFHGRPADKIRFKAGDLVEVINGDWVSLNIVYRSPPTIEEIKNRIRVACDHTDDCFTTISSEDANAYDHPEAVYLFPPRFPVSDELRKKLEEHLSGDRENTPKVASIDEIKEMARVEGQQDNIPDNTCSSFRSREEVEEFLDDLCKKLDLRYERIT